MPINHLYKKPFAKHVIAGLSLSILLIACPPACAQAVDSRSSSDQITMNMRDADLREVIQWMAEQTGRQIVLDPRVKGQVTVLSQSPMSTAEAFELFLAMLDIYGFASTEVGGILRIAPAAGSRQTPAQVISNFGMDRGAAQAVTLYHAQQVDAQQLQAILKPLMPANAYISTLKTSNSLVIADHRDNLRRLVDLAKKLDHAGELNVHTVKLQHAAADKVAGVISSLLKSDGNNTITIVSDDRSNSLLMTGEAATRDQVLKLVKQLDRPLRSNGHTKVIYLHYAEAAEMLTILKGMVAQQSTGDEQQKTSIDASESNNALIITASPDVMHSLEEVIAQIDIRRAQVLVEAIVVEVSEGFAQQLGVEWNTSLNMEDGAEALTNFGLKSVDPDSGAVNLANTAGLVLGFFNNGSLRGLIKALAADTDSNILSTPSLMTLDNEEASILVGSNVPFITGQSTSAGSSTADPFTTVERHDIGLSLKVTPQINAGDAITLDILQELETISDSAEVTSDIVTDKRSIKTKVLVEDDSILVLGGLISEQENELVSKVPVLGDLPLIGGLFRTTTIKREKRNLMVFIHPVIVDSDSIADELSGERYQLIKKLREKYRVGSFKQ